VVTVGFATAGFSALTWSLFVQGRRSKKTLSTVGATDNANQDEEIQLVRKATTEASVLSSDGSDSEEEESQDQGSFAVVSEADSPHRAF